MTSPASTSTSLLVGDVVYVAVNGPAVDALHLAVADTERGDMYAAVYLPVEESIYDLRVAANAAVREAIGD